jgi:hypothetical protein
LILLLGVAAVFSAGFSRRGSDRGVPPGFSSKLLEPAVSIAAKVEVLLLAERISPRPLRSPRFKVLLRAESYSICTSPLAGSDAVAGHCGARQASSTDTWCTHDTVQCGAQGFSV